MRARPSRSVTATVIGFVGTALLLGSAPSMRAQEPATPLLTAAPASYSTGPGAVVRHGIAITNAGEVPAIFSFEIVESPSGWSVAAPDPIELEGLTSAEAQLDVMVPLEVGDNVRNESFVRVTALAEGTPTTSTTRLTTWTGSTYTEGGFTGCRYDLDASGAVDAADVALVRAAYGAAAAHDDGTYRPELDANHDGRIRAADIQAVAGNQRECGPTNDHDTEAMRDRVSDSGIWRHLEALQEIADANGGNRASNTPGYIASADYVAGVLEAGGWTVSRPEFTYERSTEVSPPQLERVSPEPFAWPPSEFRSFGGSGNGDITAPVQGVDLVMPPGAAANTSTSGCEAADFDGFETGRIALIQRGTCTFQSKVDNAVAAGAAGILIFNEGQPERRGIVASSVRAVTGVPILGMTFAVGEDLALRLDAAAPGEAVMVRMSVEMALTEIAQPNVIAEWPHGDPNRVVMAGAHLDSVQAGPGINDNGSGSAALLEIAVQISAADLRPTNRIRLGWWGAEELGLIGSRGWVAQQDQNELDRLIMYLNFDMIGSPNWIRGVYDGDGSDSSSTFPPGSGEIEHTLRTYYDALALPHVPVAIGSRSDHAGFLAAGIPAGGLFTGAETPKSAELVALFGGEEGASLDPCYHRACDTIANVNREILDDMANAVVHTLVSYAYDPVFGLAAAAAASRPGAAELASRLEELEADAATASCSDIAIIVPHADGSRSELRATHAPPPGRVRFDPRSRVPDFARHEGLER